MEDEEELLGLYRQVSIRILTIKMKQKEQEIDTKRKNMVRDKLVKLEDKRNKLFSHYK